MRAYFTCFILVALSDPSNAFSATVSCPMSNFGSHFQEPCELNVDNPYIPTSPGPTDQQTSSPTVSPTGKKLDDILAAIVKRTRVVPLISLRIVCSLAHSLSHRLAHRLADHRVSHRLADDRISHRNSFRRAQSRDQSRSYRQPVGPHGMCHQKWILW